MTIGIIGAMDEEVTLISNSITNKKERVIANSLFVEGELGDQHVVLLKSGIGKVNAAMSTTILIEQFTPACVINTGSAGGISHELEIGDIIISDEVVHHDVDVTAFNYRIGQVPGLPAAFSADENLIQIAEEAITKHLSVNTKVGLIGTGDKFMQDPNLVLEVANKFSNLQAVEMEGAAIAQVCYQYQIPFIIIRSLSDIAGKESSISFDKYVDKAATNAASLILKMIERLNK